MKFYTGHIKENEFPTFLSKYWKNELTLKNVEVAPSVENFINLSVPAISLAQLIIQRKESNYYSRCFSIKEISFQLFEKTNEYLNKNFLSTLYKVNEVQQSIYGLEVSISHEIKTLHKQEAKWNSLFDFADEYKKVFEISDEELWFEFGNELNTYAYEIHTITQAKLLIDKSKNYLKRTKWIIYYLAYRYRSNQRSGFRHQIAFSTKYLDDEHHSEVKIMRNYLFKLPELVLYEKEKNYKPFVLYLS